MHVTDYDQRRELRNAGIQTVALLTIFSLAIVALRPSLRLGIFLVLASTFLIMYRAWALERFSPTVAGVYGRIAVANHLPEILKAIRDDEGLLSKWRLHSTAFEYLLRLNNDALASATQILGSAGMPSRRPLPLLSLLGTLVSFGLGSLLGAWLPSTSLSTAFTVLCETDDVMNTLASPGRIFLQGPVLTLIAFVVLFKAAVYVFNKMQIDRMHAIFRTSSTEELYGLLAPQFRGRRRAFLEDIDRVARVAGTSLTSAAAILNMYGIDSELPGTRNSFWRRWKLSTVNELSKNQLFFVFGLYLGLALPHLFHFGSPACP